MGQTRPKICPCPCGTAAVGCVFQDVQDSIVPAAKLWSSADPHSFRIRDRLAQPMQFRYRMQHLAR